MQVYIKNFFLNNFYLKLGFNAFFTPSEIVNFYQSLLNLMFFTETSIVELVVLCEIFKYCYRFVFKLG